MDNNTTATIQAFGEQIMNVWRGMRPTTRSLVERALAANAPVSFTKSSVAKHRAKPYDAPAEAELGRLLRALDERLAESDNRRTSAARLSAGQRDDLRRMIATCAGVLQTTAQSAEAFAQLLERAIHTHDYKAVDLLADTLAAQLPPSELCELTRHANAAVRSIAAEALAQIPVSLLVELLADPVDADAARAALYAQVRDYNSEEAGWVLETLDFPDDGGVDD